MKSSKENVVKKEWTREELRKEGGDVYVFNKQLSRVHDSIWMKMYWTIAILIVMSMIGAALFYSREEVANVLAIGGGIMVVFLVLKVLFQSSYAEASR